jgi:hypothetical protein
MLFGTLQTKKSGCLRPNLNNRPKQNEPVLLLGRAEDLHAGELRKSIKVRVTGKQDKRML